LNSCYEFSRLDRPEIPELLQHPPRQRPVINRLGWSGGEKYIRRVASRKNDFSALTDTVLDFCIKNNKEYHIKRETSKVLMPEVREKQLSTMVFNTTG
jgi:hypothetical protein